MVTGRPRRDPAAGYTLVAIVIGMAILAITLAAVGPVIATVMKRDREEELIFRGRQYARGIQLFQKRFGRFPNSLKEMYENRPRSIRKLWKDPMCRCDDWKLLIVGSPDAVAPRPGVPGAGAAPPRPTPTPSTFGSPTDAMTSGPITGVRSKLHEEALKEWRGFKFYDEWSFIAGDADSDRPANALPGNQRNPPPPPPKTN